MRYYTQIKDLTKVMQDDGFDVRILSASAEPVVRVWAEELNILGDKVMGVPLLADNGVYTGHIPGCGDVGTDQVIPYIDGKRCRINEQVFGVKGAAAFQRVIHAGRVGQPAQIVRGRRYPRGGRAESNWRAVPSSTMSPHRVTS